MKERILWIVPSRNRPEKLERFLNSWLATTEGLADMLIALDDDDNSCDHLIEKFSTVDINLSELERELLEFLIQESCDKDVSINEVISDLLEKGLEQYK